MGSLKLVCLFALIVIFINTANAALPLSGPGKGEVLDTLTPAFSWQKSNLPGITQYMVSICPDPSCIRVIYNSEGIASPSTFYTIPSGILKPNYLTGTNTPYYWQVWGRNYSAFNIDKSEIRDFWIRGTATSTTTPTTQTAVCQKDSDCGTDQWEGDAFCLADNYPNLPKELQDNVNVYRHKRKYSCGGTACSSKLVAEVYEQCEAGERCKKQAIGGAICEIQVSDPCVDTGCKNSMQLLWRCAENSTLMLDAETEHKCEQFQYGVTKALCDEQNINKSIFWPYFSGNTCKVSDDGKTATYSPTPTNCIILDNTKIECESPFSKKTYYLSKDLTIVKVEEQPKEAILILDTKDQTQTAIIDLGGVVSGVTLQYAQSAAEECVTEGTKEAIDYGSKGILIGAVFGGVSALPSAITACAEAGMASAVVVTVGGQLVPAPEEVITTPASFIIGCSVVAAPVLVSGITMGAVGGGVTGATAGGLKGCTSGAVKGGIKQGVACIGGAFVGCGIGTAISVIKNCRTEQNDIKFECIHKKITEMNYDTKTACAFGAALGCLAARHLAADAPDEKITAQAELERAKGVARGAGKSEEEINIIVNSYSIEEATARLWQISSGIFMAGTLLISAQGSAQTNNTTSNITTANTQNNQTKTAIAIDLGRLEKPENIAKGMTKINCHALDDKIENLSCHIINLSDNMIKGGLLIVTYSLNTTQIGAEGGNFIYKNLNLTFPQNSVLDKIIVKVQDITKTASELIYQAYENQKLGFIEGYELSSITENINFNQPITLTISYGSIDGIESIVDTSNLDIYYYNPLENKWVPLHANIDKTNKTLTVTITHFSKYALMEDLSKLAKLSFSCSESQLFVDNFDLFLRFDYIYEDVFKVFVPTPVYTFNPHIWNTINYDGWNPYTKSYGTRTFSNGEMTQTAYNGFERAGQETEYATVTKNTYGYGAGGYNIMAEFKAKFTNPITIWRSNQIGFIKGTGAAGSGYNYFNPVGVAVTFDEKGPQFVTNNGSTVKTTPLQIDPTVYHTYQIIWTPWFAKLLIDGKLVALHVGNIPRSSFPFVIDSKTWMHGYMAQAVVDYVKLGTACVNPNELQELGITPTEAEAQQFGIPLPDIPPIAVDDYANDNKWVIAEQAVTLTATDDRGINTVLYCIGANCEPNIQAAAIGLNQYKINFTQDMDNVARYLAIDTGSKKSRIGSFVVKLDKAKPIVNDNFDSDNVWISNDRAITIYWNDNAEIGWARYCLGADCNIEKGIDIYVPNSASAQLNFTEGISVLRYAAKDVAGNVSDAKNKTIKIDRTKPATTIRIDGNKVMLLAEDSISGIQRTYYRIDNSGWALSTEVILQEGKHMITYFSIDNANNHEEEKTETIIIDTTAPITTGASDGEWHSNDQNITLNCSDATSGCYMTRYCVHDENESCTPRTIGNNALVDCPQGEVCRKVISYYSIDNVGNIESMKTSKVIKIDKEAPLTADNASELWRNIAQEVSLMAYDYGSGAKETLFCLDKSNECLPNQQYEGIMTISDEGLTYLRYYSIDNLNNAEDTKGAFVKIDKTAPTTIDDSLGRWANTDITITLNANDELSGARGTYYRTNSSNEIAGSAINLTEEGEYAITYYSDDYAGNIEEMRSTIARIDKTKPIITDNYTNTGAWVNADQTITFNPADSLSGIAEVKYCEGTDCIPQTTLASPYALNYTTDQNTIVRYSATDNAGNISDAGQFNVKIDKTPPLLELDANPSTLWPPNKKEVDVFVSGSANDMLSGLKEVKFSVQDEYNEVISSITDFNQFLKLIAWRDGNDKDGRQYIIIAKASDNAGNSTEKQAKVIVPHDMR